MVLKEELGLKQGFVDTAHEALLNVYYTASMMKKRADAFFSQFGLTDVQFNLLTLLYFQSGDEGGLSQAQISDMMLVNRANITSLVDRMEKAGFVERTAHSRDRRFNIIKLTTKGRTLFEKVQPIYIEQVRKVMSPLNQTELNNLMRMTEKIRKELRR
ncbi:MAG: MarR family transcriptional regulator [Sedimentisphaerales bacterium]|nr:MarR family transcriptional regulator [Sedimentisphaerales bacterium]